MRMMTIGRAMLGGLALAAATCFGPAFAQSDPAANFPNRPIRMIIPFGAGGGNDLFARLVGQKFSELIGQTVVIENKPGAGGRLAAAQVMEMPADGYTLFVGASGAMSVAAAAFPNLTYHPTKTYTPLTMTANFPLILVVGPNHPAKSVKELVDWAKKNPDKSNYASSSPAFIISNELLKLKSGMPSTMIPYKSSNEMILSVAGGQTAMTILDGPPAMPMIQGGKVRALAVTGSKRTPELPNVPSMAEAGYPEVNTQLWSGFFVHGKTPPAIAAKLEDALRKAIADGGVNSKLKAMAVNPGGNASAEFRAMIDKDIEGYQQVIKAANLKFN